MCNVTINWPINCKLTKTNNADNQSMSDSLVTIMHIKISTLYRLKVSTHKLKHSMEIIVQKYTTVLCNRVKVVCIGITLEKNEDSMS